MGFAQYRLPSREGTSGVRCCKAVATCGRLAQDRLPSRGGERQRREGLSGRLEPVRSSAGRPGPFHRRSRGLQPGLPEALGRAYPDVVRQFATCGRSPGYEGGPGYRGVPPASHYIPPGLLLTPSLVGRRSADSVRTVRGVNGNAARGLVEGWSRCALLLGPPPSREAPAAEEEQRWGWTSTCSVLSVIVASQAASEKPV